VTRSRHISRDTRSGILVGIGATLVLAPLAVGLSLAALVAGVIIGAVTIGLGIAGTGGSGRGTLPVSAQVAYDQGLGVGLIVAGAMFLAVGEPLALALFAGAGAVQLLTAAVTRYSAPAAA
jgi:hypothetical protein